MFKNVLKLLLTGQVEVRKVEEGGSDICTQPPPSRLTNIRLRNPFGASAKHNDRKTQFAWCVKGRKYFVYSFIISFHLILLFDKKSLKSIVVWRCRSCSTGIQLSLNFQFGRVCVCLLRAYFTFVTSCSEIERRLSADFRDSARFHYCTVWLCLLSVSILYDKELEKK